MNKSVQIVTPKVARNWLAHSKQERLNLRRVRDYAALMDQGVWKPSIHRDTPIHIDKNKLKNGHHRLVAVLLYGKPVEMYVKIT